MLHIRSGVSGRPGTFTVETARAERMETGGCIQTLSQEEETKWEQKEGLKGCLDSGPLGKVAKSGYDRVRLFLLMSWLRLSWSYC